jgi:hypothetical protein
MKKKPPMSRNARHVLTVLVGIAAFLVLAVLVLYQTVLYGDAPENFGLILMLTVPVIVALTFRVLLDEWVARRKRR